MTGHKLTGLKLNLVAYIITLKIELLLTIFVHTQQAKGWQSSVHASTNEVIAPHTSANNAIMLLQCFISTLSVILIRLRIHLRWIV